MMLLCISNTSFHNFKGKTVYKWNIKYLPPILKKILVVPSEKHTVNVFEKRLSSAFFAISPCGCSRSLKQTKYGADYQKNFFYLFAEKLFGIGFLPWCGFQRHGIHSLTKSLLTAFVYAESISDDGNLFAGLEDDDEDATRTLETDLQFWSRVTG